MELNKQLDNDWFTLEAANSLGTRWKGKCWYIHNYLKYEFDLQFEVSFFRNLCLLSQNHLRSPSHTLPLRSRCNYPNWRGRRPRCTGTNAYNTIFFRTNKDEKRGGKICLTVHFKPLWAKNVPHFGIAHGLALGVRLPRSFILVDSTVRTHPLPLVVGTLACC